MAQASHFSPKDALDVLMSGDFKKAKMMFEAVVKQDPDNWFAWFHLGGIHSKYEQNAQAMACLYRAGELAPDQSPIWNNLGTLLRREHHTDHAKAVFLKGTELTPDDADLWSNLCTLYVNQGNPQEGLKYVNNALKFNPDHVNAQWNKSLLLLETGQLEEGFKMYEAGNRTGERFLRFPYVPRFERGVHKGRVLLYGEQGLGDEIMYYSVIPDMLKDVEHLIVECHPRLETLLQRAFPEITIYTTRKDEVVDWVDNFDAAISCGDVMQYYRKSWDDFPRKPYFSADPELVNEYRNRLHERAGEGPYLGIAWKGGYFKTRKDLRSIPLMEMEPIIRRAHEAGAKIVSFQYTDGVDIEIRQFEKEHGIKIHHWQDVVARKEADYMKTAALVECMDLIVSVNTSLVHLAGSLGKELWTMTPKGCAWRYWAPEDEKGMMWYGSVTQYRAGENMTWEPVVNRIVEDLGVKFDLLKSLKVATA